MKESTKTRQLDTSVYSNPGCGPCTATKRFLDKRGIEYANLSAGDHPDVVALALARGEAPAAPIVVVRDQDGEVVYLWTNHRQSQLEALAEILG